MEKSQLVMLAHLCQLFQDANISAIFKTSRDPEVEAVSLFLKEIGGELGSFEIRVFDIDFSLQALLARKPDWSYQIVIPERIQSGNQRLQQSLPPGVWYYNQEIVTVTIGEEKFFLIVIDIHAP